jgi:S-DNA-T family DNA segregation ATPase FtsK/SpoIIIE
MIRNGCLASRLPYLVLIIDEFADLIMQDIGDEFYTKLCRLAQKCRAARISIVLSTQRPSVNIINGSIKANFPARISCRVASQIDSKVIIDAGGAENLLGKGDALIKDNFRYLERFQIAYTTANEVCKYFGE